MLIKSNSNIMIAVIIIIISSMQLNQQEEIQTQKQSQMQCTQQKQKQKQPAFLTDSKKKFEYAFKFMYLVASIFSAVLLKKVYLFQTLGQFQVVRKGNIYDIVFYSLPFAAMFTIFDLLVHYILDDLCEKYYLTEKKYQGNSRKKRSYTLVKWAYSIFYYFISSIAAFLIIKDTNYFPYWLGGTGSCSNQFLHSPDLPIATYSMKIFYLLQFGKHFSRLFSHMFIRQEGNYYQYVLHHSLSTFLIFFSYLTNQWLVGIMVLLCHDMSDLFLIFARAYKDYKNYSKKILKISYVLAILSWVVGRLIVFPACCVYESVMGANLVEDRLSDVQKQVLMLPYRWMGFMLMGLLVLQVFWTYYISKAFVQVNVSDKIAANTYQ